MLFRAEGARVAVVKGDRVHLAPVVVGHDYGDSVEIVTGITTEDAIILDPADSLAEGAQVRVQTANTTKGAR